MRFTQEGLNRHFQQVVNYRDHALVDGWYNPPVLAELGKCVAEIEPSAAYTHCLDTVSAQFSAQLLESPEFHHMLGVWDQLDPKTEQAPYLQKCADLMASLYAKESGITVSAGKVEHYFCDKDYASDAFVGFNQDTALRDMDVIALNTYFPEKQHNLLLALQSVAHEQTHLFNLSLNTAFEYMAIDQDHPLYDEALYFREGFRKGAYISQSYGKYSPPGHNPYLLQLDERAAFRAGDGVFDTLRAAVIHGPVMQQSSSPFGPGLYRH